MRKTKRQTKKKNNNTKNKFKKLKKYKNYMDNWKAKIKKKLKPSSALLIEMNYINGSVSHFVLTTKDHKFNHKGKTYILDEDRKEYCNSTKLYMFRYHENFALPFNNKLSAADMKKAVAEKQDADLQEIETSFNPYVLKDVLKFEYAKGVIQGAEVHEYIKRSFIIGIITIAAVVIHLLLHAYKAGWI